MSTFKDRIISEHKELDDRVVKLTAFLENRERESLGEKQEVLLSRQLDSMRNYRYFLTERMKDLKVYD